MKKEFTKNEIEIINSFRKNPFLKLSILQLMKTLKSKSYQRIHESVKALEKDKILKITKQGNSNQIELQLSPNSLSHLSFFDEQQAIKSKIPHFEKIVSLKEVSYYLVIVAGSYAKGTQNKSSDLDLVVFIPDNEKPIDVQKLIENLTLSFHPKIHLYVLNNKDFIEMLTDKKENYGKEIFKNHIIIKNAHIFYELLKEAIERGFNNEKLS